MLKLDFLRDISDTDLSLSNLYNLSPENCIPIKFRPPTGSKAIQAAYEEINPRLYEEQAGMVAFRINRDRVCPLIRAHFFFKVEKLKLCNTIDLNLYNNPERRIVITHKQQTQSI